MGTDDKLRFIAKLKKDFSFPPEKRRVFIFNEVCTQRLLPGDYREATEDVFPKHNHIQQSVQQELVARIGDAAEKIRIRLDHSENPEVAQQETGVSPTDEQGEDFRDNDPPGNTLCASSDHAPEQALAPYTGDPWKERRKRLEDSAARRNLQLQPHALTDRLCQHNRRHLDIGGDIRTGKFDGQPLESPEEVNAHLEPENPQAHSEAYLQQLMATSWPKLC